jgi:hypothetical protein
MTLFSCLVGSFQAPLLQETVKLFDNVVVKGPIERLGTKITQKNLKKTIDAPLDNCHSGVAHRNNKHRNMRTKTVLAAAVGVLGAASAMAVTSVNVVGYVNVNLQPGFNLVAPPLQAANNTIGTLIPSLPNGSTLQKWDPVTQSFLAPAGFDLDIFGGWDDPTVEIKAGEAVFINVGSAATITFVGDVRQSGAGTLNTPLSPGFSIVGSQVPQTGGISSILGLAPDNGDTAQQWDPVNQHYLNPSGYDLDIFGGWDSEPVLGMAEGIVLSRGAAGSWSRNFNVQ